ncbi:hypothetical protein NECAME_17563 [Necator americanus]|uniref:Uncharacterized protein n=1 Tax=Necator americanus TaxID=51031 RepID=W2TN84_NECAM|nr:hypothetical protein NECAME_17563 [Necator americanus]ETN83129.1 hypothetical protein NECAME_17563 [Necator americanus]
MVVTLQFVDYYAAFEKTMFDDVIAFTLYGFLLHAAFSGFVPSLHCSIPFAVMYASSLGLGRYLCSFIE